MILYPFSLIFCMHSKVELITTSVTGYVDITNTSLFCLGDKSSTILDLFNSKFLHREFLRVELVILHGRPCQTKRAPKATCTASVYAAAMPVSSVNR